MCVHQQFYCIGRDLNGVLLKLSAEATGEKTQGVRASDERSFSRCRNCIANQRCFEGDLFGQGYQRHNQQGTHFSRISSDLAMLLTPSNSAALPPCLNK